MSRLRALSPSRWLAAARWLVLAWIVLTAVIQVMFLPARYQRLRSLEPNTVANSTFSGWTTEQIGRMAQMQRVSPDLIAAITFSASLICLLCFWTVGGVLFWRKSGTWTGLLAAFILFSTGPGFSNLLLTESQQPAWLNRILLLVAGVTWPTFFLMLYLFPDGKFVPRYARYLAFVPYVMFFLAGLTSRMDTPLTVILLLFALGGVASQVYRYRRVSTPEERQQTKWIVVAFGLFFGILPSSFIIPVIFPSLGIGTPQGFWWEFVGNGVVGILLPALLPLALGASILRYRLWDIDLLIRRTLSYGILTGLLGMVYFGGVTLLQSLFTAVSGQSSPAALVISTLLIAAIFNTLRTRVQDFIDRRFYRRKYDAEKALARFAAAARSETDLEAMIGKLVGVVGESLQPEHVALWLPDAHQMSVAAPDRLAKEKA